MTSDIQADALASARAEYGEFVYATRAEVTDFVDALPPEMKVRWAAERELGGGGMRYRVTFWRASLFELAFAARVTNATAETAGEVSEHDR